VQSFGDRVGLGEPPLPRDEREGWTWLAAKDGVTTAEYVDAVNVPQRSAERHLQRFTELGLVKRIGRGRGTRYEVVRP